MLLSWVHATVIQAPGMFGTLSVMLPSSFSGGEMVLQHGGRALTFGAEQLEAGSAGYVAFYAGEAGAQIKRSTCVHQLYSASYALRY